MNLKNSQLLPRFLKNSGSILFFVSIFLYQLLFIFQGLDFADQGTFATKERAQVVKELLNASSDYVKLDDYVLAYGDIPMYHYLTETRPYLEIPGQVYTLLKC